MAEESERHFLHELLFPYRGSWHMPWILERYLRGGVSGFTLRRFSNAALALAELELGVVRTRSMPIVLRVEPCNVCNLRCPLCACGNGMDTRPKGFMDLAEFRRVLEQLHQTVMIARLDGLGEPTLHPRIFDMIRMAKSYSMSVVMHSNFNTPQARDARGIVESGLDRLVISIDGATQKTHSSYRVGGSLDVVVSNLRQLVETRNSLGKRRPLVEVQTIDFDYNRVELAALRRLCRSHGVDRFQLTEAERTTKKARFDPARPRRCPWLWTVLTVGWNLEYRSCANAWSLPWPRRTMRDLPAREWWNHELLRDARRFNDDKSAPRIAENSECKCNRCYEMVVIPLRDRYMCE